MKLEFIGRGSAFNIKEGNTSAFYKNASGQMLLIDCGESVFARIIEKQVLENVKELYVVISHTHGDHIGSFTSLAFYMYYIKRQKINLILTPDIKQNETIIKLLNVMGLYDNFINYINVDLLLKNFIGIKDFKFLSTAHYNNLTTYGFEITSSDGILYFSSDTNSTDYLKEYLTYENLDKIYVDTCSLDYENNPHLSIRVLDEIIPKSQRNKVYCMHIDDSNFIYNLKQMGFNVVENI